MCIMHRIKSVFFKDFVEFSDISRKIIYIYSSVFDNRHRFFIAGHIAKQSKSGFTERPYFIRVISKQ